MVEEKKKSKISQFILSICEECSDYKLAVAEDNFRGLLLTLKKMADRLESEQQDFSNDSN
jgi:hypothetical protein